MFRQECLSARWFLAFSGARKKMEPWRRFYNEDRPQKRDRVQGLNRLVVRDSAPDPLP